MKALKILGIAALCWLTYHTGAGLLEALAHSGPGVVVQGDELATVQVPATEYRRHRLGELAAPALLVVIAWWAVITAWHRGRSKPT